VSYKGKPALQIIFSDTTQRKQAEKEIQQRTKELTILNTIADTVSRSLDLERILNSAVDAVLQMDFLGDDATCMLFLVNEQTGELSLKVNRGATYNHPCLSSPPKIGECLCGLAVQKSQVIVCADDRKDPRHSRHWEDMTLHQDICLPFKLGDKVLGLAPSDYKLLKAVADQIAVAIEKAQLFEAISHQRHQLSYLAARLTEAEETERQRLARELHDQIGQNLLGLSINLSIIGAQIPNNGAAKQARSCLQDSLALVEQTTERIRAVMADLRPPVLDDYGLMAALRWYGDQVAKRTGISVEVRGEEGNTHLSASTEMALFRVAQEALTNVSKHAQATQVSITLERHNGTQRLVVADNGQGFDATHKTTPDEDGGWGLLIMAERAEALGGRFWIESQPARGTRVIVEVG
jgi:signal transduction histidine kinase